MLPEGLLERVGIACGASARGCSRLAGGCVGDVWAVDLADGGRAVAKVSEPGGTLGVEGMMLRYLRERTDAPVPGVLLADDDLLVMEYVEHSGGGGGGRVDDDAADVLARLHSVRAGGEGERAGWCGFREQTLIGPFVQDNPWTRSWVAFYGEHRLGAMAQGAAREGSISTALATRIDRVRDRLGELIGEPAGGAGLIHGDIWGGNVLTRDGRVAALIDPAISYAHPEMELAFITMFSTFGERFFARYAELTGWEDPDGFFAQRRHVYLLYPVLVHVRLFGGGYVAQLEGTLARLGF